MTLLLEKVFQVKKYGLVDDLVILTKRSQVTSIFQGLSSGNISECTGSFAVVDGKRIWVRAFEDKPHKNPYHLSVCFEGVLSSEEKSNLKLWQKKCLN